MWVVCCWFSPLLRAVLFFVIGYSGFPLSSKTQIELEHMQTLTGGLFLHEHVRPLNKRFAWRVTTGSAFIKMSRLKAIIEIILLINLGECARDLTKCVVWSQQKRSRPALT